LYRIRDFIFMDAVDLSGNLLGFISDIFLDFNKKQVKGFVITPNNIFKKSLNVFMKDIVSLTSVIVITNANKDKYFQFNDIKRMNVVDEKGCLIGMVEDILFDEENFCIKAVILSTGFINNFIKGKKIVLIDDLTLGEENLFYRGKKENLKFFNSPHVLFNSDKASERK